MTDVTPDLPPVKVAFAIDGQIVEVLHTDDRLAAIFLSQPEVFDATGADGKPTVKVGWVLGEDGKYHAPAE